MFKWMGFHCGRNEGLCFPYKKGGWHPGYVFVVVTAFLYSELLLAGATKPIWATSTHLRSDDGYATLAWTQPEGKSAGIYKITEVFNENQSVHYVESNSLRAWRAEPGEYIFTVQACDKTADKSLECGVQSDSLSLTITDSLTAKLITANDAAASQPAPAANIDGGPDQLLPGQWYNRAKDGHGWSFYWANRLALSENDPLFGNAYDLVGVWYTYEAKSAQNAPGCSFSCPLETSNYRPFVLKLKAISTGVDSYGGSLYASRADGTEVWVGSADLIFGNENSSATMHWNASFKKETLSGSDSLNFLHGSDPGNTNNISHFSGIWADQGDDRFYVVSNIGQTAEINTVVFHDDAGDPTWIQAVTVGTPVSTSSDICLAYLSEGYAPQLDKPADWSKNWFFSGCDSSSPVNATNRNGLRYFSGLDKAHFWANFVLPATELTNGSISIGSSSSRVSLTKTASFHGVKYNSVTGVSCELAGASGSCDLQLTWFTDGNYPEATVFARNRSDNSYEAVGVPGQISVSEFPYQLTTPGTFEFQLRMGNSPQSTLMAKSALFTVTEKPANSPPVLQQPAGQFGYLDDPVALQLSASDPDSNDLLTFSAQGLPPGLSINSTTGLIHGTLMPPIGSYLVTATVTDSQSDDSASFNWNVQNAAGNPEVPPAPATPPSMTADSISSKVGATVGEFQVAESGAATYSIPILTAPASGGVHPQISLNYSSLAGNGSIGIGWALAGVSSITLCPQTMEQDGLTGSKGISLNRQDRFCLDGQRLMADTSSGEYGAHGTQYRTEIDGFARITSYGVAGNGPAWFKVERKDGSIVEYGRTENSRIEARGSKSPTTVFTWAQNRFEDRFGNYIKYQYLENSAGPVSYDLKSIDYTGNSRAGTLPGARITLTYSDRSTDFTSIYFSGMQVEQRRLLRSIRSQGRLRAGSAFEDLRFYELSYEEDGVGRQVLTQLTECRSMSRDVCYQPTRFDWHKSESMIETSTTLLEGLLPKRNLSGLTLADVSGDGRPDVLYTNTKSKNHTLHVKEATTAIGFTDWATTYKLPKKSDGKAPRVFTIDINSDGIQDLVYSKYSKPTDNYSWVALISNGKGFSSEVEISPGNRFHLDEDNQETGISVMDFNGDGLSDILHVEISPDGNTSSLTIRLNLSTPGGNPVFAAPIELDVDNSDLFPSENTGAWDLSELPLRLNWELSERSRTDAPETRIFDFNADGAADLLLKIWRDYQRCVSNCELQPNAAGGKGEGRPYEEPVYEYESASFWVLMESTGQNSYLRHSVVALGEDCLISEICRSPEYEGLPRTDHIWPVNINSDDLADLAWGNPRGEWHFQINTGLGFMSPEPIGQVPNVSNKHVRFEDWNGDGFVDLIYPSAILNGNARWMVYQNHFGRAFASSANTMLLAGNVGGDSEFDPVENDSSVFVDFDGDGKMDRLFINNNKQGEILSTHVNRGINVNGSRAVEPANVITAIDNGFGAVTKITYRPLTDSEVYTRTFNSLTASWGLGAPVYDYIAPVYVVSKVTGSSPVFANPGAESSTEFHYVGAKVQAGGRGLLGFGEVIAYDPQLQIRSNTRYRQDFPFIGLPLDTTKAKASSGSKFDSITITANTDSVAWPSVTPDTKPPSSVAGTILSYSVSQWRESPTTSGARRIYSDKQLTRSYTLAGNLASKVLTQNDYDSYANLTKTTTQTFADDGQTSVATRTMNNTWSAVNKANWTLGRLTRSVATHKRTGESAIVRTSAFEYDLATGSMTKEFIEPGDAKLNIVTTFSYDQFGNRVATSKKAAGMLARTSIVSFESLGRFVVRETNALGQLVRKVPDGKWDVFGNSLEIVNIDGVVSKSAADLMGRAFASSNQTGAWQKTLNRRGRGNHCPEGTIWYAISELGGGTKSMQCFDGIGRVTRKITQGIDNQWVYSDQYFDTSGRLTRVSEPYFRNSTRYWSETAFDRFGRVTDVLSAGGDDISIQYDEAAASHCTTTGPGTTVTTNALGQQSTEVKNVLGETTDSYDNDCAQVAFQYDSMGQLTSVSGADGSTIRMVYDAAGRKIAQSDPDKGNWQYAYNALGELTRQLDGKHQAIDFEYDRLGRITDRRELMNVASLADSGFDIVNHETTAYKTTGPGKSQPGRVTYRAGESGEIVHQRKMTYDWLGRVSDVVTNIGNDLFYVQTTYDAYGRVFQQFDASGDDRGLRYQYSNGYLRLLKEAREGVSGQVYQEILDMDARGNVTRAMLGNGVTAIADYHPSNGHLTSLRAYDPMGVELQDVNYLFDVLGNLKSRHDLSGQSNLKEDFAYDALNRLKQVRLTAPGLGISSPVETLALNYDAVGNIIWKSDVGAYSYGSSLAGPHAVTRAGSANYAYDTNGNQLNGNGRNISYTVFDKAARMETGRDATEFTYGIGHQRVKRQDSISGEVNTSTLYLGNVEYLTSHNGRTQFKRYLAGVAIATFYPATSVQQVSYLLKDHIGSIHSILSEEGLVTGRQHFSPFGERQDIDWQSPLDSFLYSGFNGLTTRGFTGHEHVDSMGIIHMNGRIYDPKLGRFLQADTFVQAPGNAQSLNRYSYVFNNPLSNTDPSGHFSLSRFFKKWGRTIAAIVASYFLPGAGGILSVHFGVTSSFAQYVITGFIAGGITGGIKGAVKGAFIAAITYGVTEAFNQMPDGKVQLNEGAMTPSKQQMEHMLGTRNPGAGMFKVEVLPRGEFASVRSISANELVSGDSIIVNGMRNNFQEAVRNGTTQVAQLDGVASGYVLNFNPTKSIVSDAFEALQDINSTYFGFGQTELAENLAKVIDTASRNGVTGLRLIGHSQGAAITSSAMRFAADTGLNMSALGSVNFHGAPLNDIFLKKSFATRTGIRADAMFIRAQFGDPVHNILGANFISNPLRLPFSAVRIPHLFSGDATLSPHTVPCFGGRTALCSG